MIIHTRIHTEVSYHMIHYDWSFIPPYMIPPYMSVYLIFIYYQRYIFIYIYYIYIITVRVYFNFYIFLHSNNDKFLLPKRRQ
jgi:hypothetical protein